MFKRILFFLTVLLLISSTAFDIIGSKKFASGKVVNSKDYHEIQGVHLMMNVTGVDENGKIVYLPQYLEFPLTEGDVLNYKFISEKVQQTLDASGHGKFQFVGFLEGTKIEWNYKNEQKFYDITDSGFKVPDYTKYEKTPNYKLIGKVIVKENNIKDTKQYFENGEKVEVFHEVKFMKRDGDSDVLFPTSVYLDTSFEKMLKIGDKVNPDELYKAANERFKQTDEYKQWYRIVKRLTTSAVENESNHREIYHHLDNPIFEYTISNYREMNGNEHIEGVSEQYYISKNGDDYYPDKQDVEVAFKNESGMIFKKINVSLTNSDIVRAIKGYLRENNLIKIKGKNGEMYIFKGNMTKNGEKSYVAEFQ